MSPAVRLGLAAVLLGRATALGTTCAGHLSSCECLLSCEVFGAEPGKCKQASGRDADINAVVQDVVIKSFQSTIIEDPDCKGIQCIVSCAKKLGCLDYEVRGQCENVKGGNGHCRVDCSGSSRAALPVLPLALLVALVGIADRGHRSSTS